jgi:hypothetical protein
MTRPTEKLRAVCWLGGLLVLLVPAGARAQKESAKEKGPTVVRLAPTRVEAGSALRYRLLPDPLDLQPGNAAPLWVRAGLLMEEARQKLRDKKDDWYLKWVRQGTEPPKDKARELLGHYAVALRMADLAARRTRCDWERPPLTIQSVSENLPLVEVQLFREIARLLEVRYRLELGERDFDKAAHTLQTGLALARDVGDTDLLIQSLVGTAIATVMFGEVERWIQTPGSPNLYWSLTVLPDPFIDCTRAIRYELNTLHRSFPQLRQFKKGELTDKEASRLLDEVFKGIAALCGEAEAPPAVRLMGTAALVLRYKDQAEKYLLDRGYTKKQVQAMPATQVVVLAFVEENDRVSAEAEKWMAVPYWQGGEEVKKVTRKAAAALKEGGNPLLGLLMPAVEAVYRTRPRLARYVAGLRAAEALRLHTAAHDGKLPQRWDQVAVPEPIDPYTGKGIGRFYQVEKGVGILAIPGPPETPRVLARRYELRPKK